jgi:hypothetical protein
MPSLYEKDFYEWSMKTADLVRSGKFAEIDTDNLAEELESLGRSEKREFLNRLKVLLIHLLKWQHQPAQRSISWQAAIMTQRDDIRLLLEDNPSFRRLGQEVLERAYPLARKKAAFETGIDIRYYPAVCPYAYEQVMDDDFWPSE